MSTPTINPHPLLNGLGISGKSPLPWWGLMLTAIAVAATAGVGINIQNSCQNFGSSATVARVNGLYIYNIIVLIFGIFMFIASFAPTFGYFYMAYKK